MALPFIEDVELGARILRGALRTAKTSESIRVLIAMKVCTDKQFALAGRCVVKHIGILKK